MNRSINKEILRLAIPNIISNITVPLLGMVDMYVVGHLDSQDYIGAIALATLIFNFIFWNFSFLRMSTTGFTAQACGAGDGKEQVGILLRSLALAMVLGLFIVASQGWIVSLGFRCIAAGASIKVHAASYLHIYLWAAPAVLGMYALNGWFVGMQNAKTPMYIAICMNIINISLCFFLVYEMGMTLEGVAWASLVAQYIGFGLSLTIAYSKYGGLRHYVSLVELKKRSSYLPFFRVNTDIFIRTLALVGVTTFFLSASALLGDSILAVNALLMQLFILFSYLMDGFAYAAEALTGKYIGARNRKGLAILVKQFFKWGFALALFFTVCYALFAQEILSLLTNKEQLVILSKEAMPWIACIPLASFAAFLWDGVFVGATASRQMRNSMLIAVCAFFAAYILFSSLALNNSLWISFIVYLSLRGIVQSFMARTILNGSK